MAVGDVYSLAIMQRLHAQKIINVLHYREKTTPITGTSPASLLGGFLAISLGALKLCQSNELQHEGVVVQKIYPLPPNIAVTDTSALNPGAVAQNSLPTSVAAVITKRTLFAGRAYRGRLFIAGIPNTSENDSQMAAGALTAMQTFADTLTTEPGTSGGQFQHILWHRTTLTYHLIYTCAARPILRNQRRRQVGRGI